MNAPKQTTWIAAIVIAVVAVVQEFDVLDLNLGAYTFYLMIVSVVLLALGARVKGM